MLETPKYVLVTGATGFIGAHVVDQLLSRGFRVRGATRSLAKGKAMIKARPQFASALDFVEIDDFGNPGRLDDAVHGIDAVIHVASPLTYDTKDNEKELIIPAINGVKAILEASANGTVRRVVLTSSFAAVMDADRTGPPYFVYTGQDWNPLTYRESTAPTTPAYIAYRGAKKFAEKAAWDFVRERRPGFDLVTLCPSMTFGPVVHPIANMDQLNESNAMLWRVAQGQPLATARVPSWIDVRDLATAHVEALLRPSAGGQRFIVGGSERFSYDLAAQIIEDEFGWAKGKVKRQQQAVDESYGIDGETAARELGLHYTSFKTTVVDLISQLSNMQKASQ
ncbi:NAD dependent epimerase/dehydratase [Niveomyces insectorum RCEF 264]|uniref:NAD dependent epimerase/dehydratase n=1 Tax=Niveomyces insectorum RCEF 264 TaxID=1081102 RepID=A0A162MT54_9HYPO|nr:NAD dependent epimerase/dehydratase [Niveomyces insectorum RCEF 264]